MHTFWVPHGETSEVRRLYRESLLDLGWHPGAWRRTAAGSFTEGPTHVCVPTGAGTFLLPPAGVEASDLLARTLSRLCPGAVLESSPRRVQVLSSGGVRARFARGQADVAALSVALGVDALVVGAFLRASEARESLGAGALAAGADVWELVALRVALGRDS